MSEENKNEHLPLYGVGPFYNYGVLGLTLVGILCKNFSFLSGGNIHGLRTPLFLTGLIMIIGSLWMWLVAVKKDKLFQEIESNHLVTTGIFSYVRNPIYSSVMIFCTGLLIIAGNWYLIIVLPSIFWLFMTVLMINTEEKWLKERYGQKYEDYCKQVNRCIPWPSKKLEKLK
ncbi:hypothetical protein H8356DRAFT_963338 [Neocallimastix lanati (nom. inval.)]|uniref:Protein-S-isoprenylcysteine O-methyltransferase n=1 Tax=Neocallimastix californiae TaxID=1754190 RepID=A0A1Y2EYS2_9FUNG|nr:hypothetical protein H8356DRAFT_963338 [Neocallimastix sp. JGI-2020a]ORY76414.1 hypothetical protein LY90DRAFT_501729 [Neocallimastix californiae]|eukprot:ORY76414.1 hypothetical protein LY90DRAFT_501729 [Neocallimastix californiae]